MNKVIIASHNKGKIREISSILEKFGMECLSRDEAGLPTFEIDETGDTFEENSYLKAKTIFDLCNLPTVADDSGLEVDCLGGAPGVYSARFAGEGCTPLDNNLKLIEMLRDVPYEERTGKYVSVITMLYPDGEKLIARGEVSGHLLTELRGEEGFGYDPLFVPEGFDKTFGEMTLEEKNSISHRAKSLIKLEELIFEKERRKSQ